jgi:HEAT repeat protein
MVLAQLGDERGFTILRETLRDTTSSQENQMRAAVGLGRSGDASTKEFLEGILSEGQYVVDAAGALASLGESSATPALLRQLELTSMRVQAAENLKKIGEKVDLEPMASALKSGSVDGRIAVAEAILILTDTEEQE